MRQYSFILPVRNGGAYVKECVASILRQTHGNFNFLVLDNCSTDGTPEWIESLNDTRIRVFRSDKPLSIEQNWARIKELEKNEFMTMTGHDDVFAPNYLAEMDALINKHPDASLYQAHFKYIDGNGNPIVDCHPMDEVQKAHEFLACQMNDTIHSTGTGYVMRSKNFNEAGGMPVHYPNLIYSDFELWIRLAVRSYKATTLAETFYYRAHMSVSRTTNGEQYAAAFHEYVRFLNYMKTQSADFATVINRYGMKYLLKMCESLAHRMLKTPDQYRTGSVNDLIEKFRGYAQLLLPDTVFDPIAVPRIKYALWLDSNRLTRTGFRTLRRFLG